MQSCLQEDRQRYRRPIVSNVYHEPTDLFDRHLYEKRALVLLVNFADDPSASSEGILEAIQMAWLEYSQED